MGALTYTFLRQFGGSPPPPALGSDVDPSALSPLASVQYGARDNVFIAKTQVEGAVAGRVIVRVDYAGGGSPQPLNASVYALQPALRQWTAIPAGLAVPVVYGQAVIVPVPASTEFYGTFAVVITSPGAPAAGTYVVSAGTDFGTMGGPTGGGNVVVQAVPFAFNTPSPLLLQAVAAGDLLLRAVVAITAQFDDPAARVQLGTSLSVGLVLGGADVTASVVDQYESGEFVEFAGPDVLLLSIAPGASTQGAGLLLYEMKA